MVVKRECRKCCPTWQRTGAISCSTVQRKATDFCREAFHLRLELHGSPDKGASRATVVQAVDALKVEVQLPPQPLLANELVPCNT